MTMTPNPPGLPVASIQCDIVWEDARTTCNRLRPRIEAAVGQGAQFIVLPEMFATGFSLDTDAVAEPPDGAIASFLRDQAERYAVHVGGSFACRVEPGELPVNRFLIAGPHGDSAQYDKIHPFSYGGEDKHYAKGTAAITVDIGEVRVTPFVCYDLRFADWFWRAAPATDCYVVVANWPAPRAAHWRALLIARAIENQAYVVGVNRVGEGGGDEYDGGSIVVDPFGDVLHEADADEELFISHVDPGRV